MFNYETRKIVFPLKREWILRPSPYRFRYLWQDIVLITVTRFQVQPPLAAFFSSKFRREVRYELIMES